MELEIELAAQRQRVLRALDEMIERVNRMISESSQHDSEERRWTIRSHSSDRREVIQQDR